LFSAEGFAAALCRSMPSSRCGIARDPRQAQIHNAGNLSLQGVGHLDQFALPRRHFLGREVVHRCSVDAALDNTLRQRLGFIPERRYFFGGRGCNRYDQVSEDLANDGECSDNFRHSLGAVGNHLQYLGLN
jgi:hypothetical protein